MKNAWVYGVVIAIVGLTAVFIVNLRLSEIPDLAIGHSSAPPLLGKPREKIIDYEVDGPAGTPAKVSYLDGNSAVQNVSVSLPWRISLRTSALTMATGVVAQSDADRVSCRIVVNGEPRDTQAANGQSSAVNCNVLVS